MLVYGTSFLFCRTVELLVQIGRIGAWCLLRSAFVLVLSITQVVLRRIGSW